MELCRADIPVVHGLPALSLPGMQWQAAARVHMREACHRAHFAALCLFGVLPPCDCVVNVASLAVLAVSTPETSLLPDLLSSQQQDPFLQQVAEGVDSINQGVWLDFLRNEQGLLCYSIDGDATCHAFACPRYRGMLFFMPHTVELLLGIRVSRARPLTWLTFFGGQIFFATSLTSSVVVVRVLLLKVLLVCSWGLTRSPVYQCSCLPIGVWISSARCPSRV